MAEFPINPKHNVFKKYRTVNYINSYVFAPPIDLSTNTEIGGVASAINTPALLASKLAIDVNRITNFQIVGSDIKCKITGSYAMPISCWGVSPITYYRDNDNLVTSLLLNSFRSNSNLPKIEFNGVLTCGGYQTSYSQIGDIILPNCTVINDYAFFDTYNYASEKKIVIPRCTTLGSSALSNNVFQQGIGNKTLIYAHPSLATNNGGAPDGDIAYAISGGATIRYVTNYIAPNQVITLSAGAIYNTAVRLNFTAPSSTNAIEYYECYVNGVFKNKITASGGYITGLTALTLYNITVIAVDIFYNKSVVSNSLSVSTNTAVFMSRDRMVAYYKLDETTGATANDSFSTQHLTNTGITINQSGKVGQSYLATTLGQKLATTLATPITEKFTINCWVYRTATSGNLGGIMQQGDFATNNGFGMWIWASGNLSWRINQIYNSSDSATFAIPLNTWKMITMVYNQVNVKIYIDSVLKATTAHTANPGTVAKRTLFYNQNNNAEFFGRIDEASFYNGELIQTEIDELYNSGTGTTL
jgi:hypothetical protein